MNGAYARLGLDCPLYAWHRASVARILLISSLTAGSHVGSTVSAFIMRRLGVDVAVLPTTLFGRHPGWGLPGGTITPPEVLQGMWDGLKAQLDAGGRPFDGIMTGYMGDESHIDLACEAIDTLKPDHILVDPVMGDWDKDAPERGRLYIPKNRAEALCDELVPRAHIVTPNSWEWRYLTGSMEEPRADPPRPLAGMRETLVTSVEAQDKIGAMLFSTHKTYRILHDRYPNMPHGGGDALAADYLAHRVLGQSSEAAFSSAISSVFAMMRAADVLDAGELPFVRAQDTLKDAAPLTMETL
jgi:pyridoxine kinase